MKKMGTGRERGRLSPGRLRDPGSCVGKESPRTSTPPGCQYFLIARGSNEEESEQRGGAWPWRQQWAFEFWKRGDVGRRGESWQGLKGRTVCGSRYTCAFQSRHLK